MTQVTDDDDLYRKRLLIGTSRVKALVQSFAELSQRIVSEKEAQWEASFTQLAKNLMFTDNWIRKQNAARAALEIDQEEYQHQRQYQEEAILEAITDVEHSKAELKQARTARQHREEYKALEDQIMQHQSRAATLQQCGELEADIRNLELESTRLNLLADKRRKQFALLYHCIEDLVENDNDEVIAEPSNEPSLGELEDMEE